MKSDDLIKQVHRSFVFMVNRSTLSVKKSYTFSNNYLEIKSTKYRKMSSEESKGLFVL